MHELSIAQSLVQIVVEALPRDGAGRVVAVRLRVGALAGVVAEALRFGFEVVARGTPLEDARLEVQELPLMIHCPACDRSVELPGTWRLRCPICDTPSAAIVQGKELEVESIEVAEEDDGPARSAP